MELRHYTRSTRITNFYPVPRSVLSLKLPAAAVLVYAILLDRGTLSQKNDYTDAAGWVYVVYTQEELAEALDISTRMVRRYIRQLSDAGLMRTVRKSLKNGNRYYLLLPADSVMGTTTGQKCPTGRTNTSCLTGHPCPPNNRKEQQDISNLYQHGEEESL